MKEFMSIEEILKAYPYKYETHMHTSQGSKCGKATGRDMARCYKENGYTGVFITDHNWGGNTAVDRSLPWEEWVDNFFAGYREAKAEGDAIGLKVFPAWEAGYHGPEFLIYGVTPEEMKAHPEFLEATVEEQYKLVHSLGGMVIQAHPFRTADYIAGVELFPDWCDGAEIINASHSNALDGNTDRVHCDTEAIAYAKEKHLPGTAGSDQHSTAAFGGGMLFKKPIETPLDYMDMVMNGGDYILTNGRQYFDKEGNLLAE
ncbi:MAG: PHP domain-containing protein [Lachnospiraceae bacterium]|nr:PHP domain-containing protein [Lachnospiraceae bacterium]